MLYFGTAGIPASTKGTGDTVAGLKRVRELGLSGMEIEFVRNIYLRDHTAPSVAYVASKLGLRLSCHAPYYLNLNAASEEILQKSCAMVFNAARIAALAGAGSLVFHAGYYLKGESETVYQNIKTQLELVLNRLWEEDIHITLRPEIAGKTSQFGTLSELLRLCRELPGTAPAIDFAHLHAVTGRYNTYLEFAEVLTRVGETLGNESINDLHLHVSGIEAGKSGERRHLNLQETDYQYEELLQTLADFKAGGLLICESPNIEDDAVLLHRTWRELVPHDCPKG